MERRSFLQGAGVVTVLVAGGVVWRAHDRGVFSVGQGPAYEPWKNWQESSAEEPMALVRAAILAASPHNTQPWLFKVSPEWIELYLDTSRNAGALDPYLREAHIGMGCALENLLQAAAANSYTATLALVPGELTPTPSERTQKLLARVELTRGKREASELYTAIPQRHTNRGAYDIHKPVPGGFVDALRALPANKENAKIFLFSNESERKKIAAMSSAANDEIYADPVVDEGSQRWFRLTWSAVQKYRDGLTVDAAGLPPVATAIVKIVPRRVLNWLASRQPKDAYAQLMLSAPLIGVIAVRDRYDQEDCMRAGRLWQRAHLLATARGLAARPCNEAVEMIDYEKAHGKPAQRAAMLAELLGDASWQPAFVFYMGYPLIAAHASPRRPVSWVAAEVKA